MIVPDTGRSKQIFDYLQECISKDIIIDWDANYKMDGEE